MVKYVFIIGALSCFLAMRIIFFNYEMKRSPLGFKDFMQYRMRKVTVIICSLLSLIVLSIGVHEAGGGVSPFLFFFVFVFLIPIAYVVHLVRKDSNSN